jgi:hypothetical protein
LNGPPNLILVHLVDHAKRWAPCRTQRAGLQLEPLLQARKIPIGAFDVGRDSSAVAPRDLGDVAAIFAEIDRLGGADFLPEGRPEQPAMPMQRAAFEE